MNCKFNLTAFQLLFNTLKLNVDLVEVSLLSVFLDVQFHQDLVLLFTLSL